MEEILIFLIYLGIMLGVAIASFIITAIAQIISCSIFKINLLQTMYNKMQGKGGIVKWQN